MVAGVAPRNCNADARKPNGPHSAGSVTVNNPTVGVPAAQAKCITPQSALTYPPRFAITAAILRTSLE